MEKLLNLKNIPVTGDILNGLLGNYKASANKLSRLVAEGILVHLRKNLYIVSPKLTKCKLSEGLMANHIYNPSYVSMLTALRIYGIIPERVATIQSMTVKKSWTIRNDTGYYTYTCCDSDYYKIGITYKTEEGISYMIATPEKALCDWIAYTPGINLRFISSAKQCLADDMRMDLEFLKNMDISLLEQCLQCSKKKESIKNVIKFIERI